MQKKPAMKKPAVANVQQRGSASGSQLPKQHKGEELSALGAARAMCTHAFPASRIAVVDISPLLSGEASGSLAAAQRLSAGFADTGFAIATGTKIPVETISTLRALATKFFAQGQEAKRAVNEGMGEGYGQSPYCCMEENGAQLLGDFTRPTDVVESLTYRGLSEKEVVDRLPESPPGLAQAISAFNEDLEELRRALERACELALDLEPGLMTRKCQEGKESLRLAYYPSIDEPLEGQMRYGAHVDSYGLTVLSLDPANPGGLQVQIDDEWIDVPFVEGGIVLNVGALLSRWTNGSWKASVHRVLCKPGDRLSIVSGAVRPADDELIEVFPSCCDASHTGEEAPPPPPPILARDFFAERVTLHRPSYLSESGAASQEPADLQKLQQDIRSYRI